MNNRLDCILIATLAICYADGVKASPSYEVIHLFGAVPSPVEPAAWPIVSTSGDLFGTSFAGGAQDQGSVYQATAPGKSGKQWRTRAVFSFPNARKRGRGPQAALVEGPGGTLYGATPEGGADGSGVIFAVAPPVNGATRWTETVLHTFSGGDDGAQPFAEPVIGPDGALYGTTRYGGAGGQGFGTVYRLAVGQDGSVAYSVIYRFPSNGTVAGSQPVAPVTFDSAGNIYGSTFLGGPALQGVVFRLSPQKNGAYREDVLFDFPTLSDGIFPQSPVTFDASGNLYGTTSAGGAGGGVVYRLTPPGNGNGPWSESVLHSLAMNEGSDPARAPVLIDKQGNLWGTAEGGGAANLGAVWMYAPAEGNGSATFTVVHSFSGGADGANPQGLALAGDGTLYGATAMDGGPSGSGTLFQVTP
jgi:uncharacterized repeat protein (TIGR03803 family)